MLLKLSASTWFSLYQAYVVQPNHAGVRPTLILINFYLYHSPLPSDTVEVNDTEVHTLILSIGFPRMLMAYSDRYNKKQRLATFFKSNKLLLG